eukprot:3282598-Amphidinium_carterae.1
MHATGYTTPERDAQQDLTLLSIDSSNGEIIATIQMPLESCDEDDYPVLNITQTLLWAMGSSTTFGYHGSIAGVDRGSLEVNFFQAEDPIVDPEDAFTLDITMPNVS